MSCADVGLSGVLNDRISSRLVVDAEPLNIVDDKRGEGSGRDFTEIVAHAILADFSPIEPMMSTPGRPIRDAIDRPHVGRTLLKTGRLELDDRVGFRPQGSPAVVRRIDRTRSHWWCRRPPLRSRRANSPSRSRSENRRVEHARPVPIVVDGPREVTGRTSRSCYSHCSGPDSRRSSRSGRRQ